MEIEIVNLKLSQVFYVKEYLENHPHYVGIKEAD